VGIFFCFLCVCVCAEEIHRACFHQMMIIAACPSHTRAPLFFFPWPRCIRHASFHHVKREVCDGGVGRERERERERERGLRVNGALLFTSGTHRPVPVDPRRDIERDPPGRLASRLLSSWKRRSCVNDNGLACGSGVD